MVRQRNIREKSKRGKTKTVTSENSPVNWSDDTFTILWLTLWTGKMEFWLVPDHLTLLFQSWLTLFKFYRCVSQEE